MWYVPLMLIIPGTTSARQIDAEVATRLRVHFMGPAWLPGACIWDARLLRAAPPDRQPPPGSRFGRGDFCPADTLRRRYPGRRIQLPSLLIDLEGAFHRHHRDEASWRATLAAAVDVAPGALVLLVAVDAQPRDRVVVPSMAR